MHSSTTHPSSPAARRSLRATLVAALLAAGCRTPTEPPPLTRPQTVVLLATPKILPDFADPDSAVGAFLDHYAPLTSRADEVIVIFGVGNSDHILNYGGMGRWSDAVEWARTTEYAPVSGRRLDYHQLAGIVTAFERHGALRGLTLKVYDLVDSGDEFTVDNVFKYLHHRECTDDRWGMFDVRARLHADQRAYASAPGGIPEGRLCGEFLVDQLAHYLPDLGFDGILYKNQLGTRGRWAPDNGPGYTDEEADAIRAFLAYSRRMLPFRELMWFDSYNEVRIEHDIFSFPPDGYGYFDYLIAAGFCVVTEPDGYLRNLESKLALTAGPRVLATLDYVDPWYYYNSLTTYPRESAQLEAIAIRHRDRLGGIMLFANDEMGVPVPRAVIESFASRYFGAP